MNEPDHVMSQQLAHWARQTVLFAIGLRAEADGSPLDQQAQLRHAGSATQKIVDELWAEVYRECPDADRFVMQFARRVLDWAQDHRAMKDDPE